MPCALVCDFRQVVASPLKGGATVYRKKDRTPFINSCEDYFQPLATVQERVGYVKIWQPCTGLDAITSQK